MPKRETDWLQIVIGDGYYRIKVTASNSKNIQGKVKAEKYIDDDWKKIGWNGILNLFSKIPVSVISFEEKVNHE